MTLRGQLQGLKHWLTGPADAKAEPPRVEVKSSAAMEATFRYLAGVEHYPPRDYKQLMHYAKTNPIVRRALKLTSEAVAQLKPEVHINGVLVEDGARMEIAGRGSAKLDVFARYIAKPNPDQDFAGFIARLAGFYKASGNGWVELVRGVTGEYAEFYALRPDLMLITPGRNGWPEKYAYQPGSGVRKEWPVDVQNGKRSILHVKDEALDDDLYGHGALEAADKPLRIYDSAYELAASQFANGAVPRGAFVYDPQVPPGSSQPMLTEDQAKAFEQKVKDKFGGVKKAGAPAIFSAGWRWEPISMTMVDLEAMEIRFAAARDIALSFGVPPMLLGIPGDNTYANFSEASRAFYRSTVLADAKRIYGAIARWWSALTGIEGLELVIDEEKIWALADELSEQWARTLSADVLTFEEKREAIGYQREAPGEDHFFDASFGGALMPVRGLIAGDLAGGPPQLGPPRQARVVEDDE